MGQGHDRWLTLCISRCQYVAGRIYDSDPLVLLLELRRLVSDIPANSGVIEHWLLRSLLGQAACRIVNGHGLDGSAVVARAFFAFASSGLTPGHWQREFLHLVECCEFVRQTNSTGGTRVSHLQVERTLRVLDTRCTEVGLNLRSVATEVGLSPWHLSRLLKSHTGYGFVSHLHQRRVSAARDLLTHSHLSIKEIAASVGYRSATQLGRHFKRLCGSSPISIRTPRHI